MCLHIFWFSSALHVMCNLFADRDCFFRTFGDTVQLEAPNGEAVYSSQKVIFCLQPITPFALAWPTVLEEDNSSGNPRS